MEGSRWVAVQQDEGQSRRFGFPEPHSLNNRINVAAGHDVPHGGGSIWEGKKKKKEAKSALNGL